MRPLHPISDYPEPLPYEPLPDETPTEYHAWYAPFHHAIASGMVDGRITHTRGPVTGGSVSDDPNSESR